MIQKLAKRRKRQDEGYPKRRYQQLIQYKKEALQNKLISCLLGIRMSEMTLKFELIKKKFINLSNQSI